MNYLKRDLDHILTHTRHLWEEIRNKSLFVTGGTGFFGCWLLESFAWANDRLGLNAQMLVLTRDKESFRKKAPHLASNPAIDFIQGDIRSFDYPSGSYSYIIHAATETDKKLNDNNPLLMYETITLGAQRILDFASSCGAKKILLTSSGVIYGRQPSEMPHIHEEYHGAFDPTDPNAAYAEGKRASEFLFAAYSRKYSFDAKIARCFAFVGPYMPIDVHFAIGNFIRDGLQGSAITIKGDGSPYRSYLYAADLAIWLWTILFCGRSCIPYNVGSSEGMQLSKIAKVVANIFGEKQRVVIMKPTVVSNPERYVPDIERTTNELGLQVFIDLPEAVRRTVEWHRNVSKVN